MMEDKKERQKLTAKKYYEANKEKMRLRRKAYYEANKEREAAVNKAYREANPEKIKAIRVAYCEANKERNYKRTRAWREENKDLANGLTRKWRAENPVKVYEDSARRRAAEIQRTPAWLNEEQKQEIRDMYEAAYELSKVFPYKLHVDHIVPLRGDDASGLHVPWNLQLLPAAANMSKSNKLESLT